MIFTKTKRERNTDHLINAAWALYNSLSKYDGALSDQIETDMAALHGALDRFGVGSPPSPREE